MTEMIEVAEAAGDLVEEVEVADFVVDVIQDPEKCTGQFVTNAAKTVKCHSGQVEASQSFAVIVLKEKKVAVLEGLIEGVLIGLVLKNQITQISNYWNRSVP